MPTRAEGVDSLLIDRRRRQRALDAVTRGGTKVCVTSVLQAELRVSQRDYPDRMLLVDSYDVMHDPAVRHPRRDAPPAT